MHDGQMEKITPEMARRMKDARRSEVSRARTLEEQLQLAAMRGYSSGWAYWIHTARLGKTQLSLNHMLQVRIRRMDVTMSGFGITRDAGGVSGPQPGIYYPRRAGPAKTGLAFPERGTSVSEFFKTPDGVLSFF